MSLKHGMACLALAPLVALAAAPEESRSARLERDRAPALATLKAATGQPAITYGLGLSHDRDEDGIEVSTVPMYFVYRTPSAQWWQLYVGTEGYTRVGVPGSPSVIGLSDLSLSLTHRFSGSFLGSVSAVVPSHGDVGSGAGAQAVRLTWRDTVAKGLALTLRGTLARSDAQVDGVSRMSQSLYGALGLALDPSHSLDLWASRSHRSGALGRTELGADLGWSLSPRVLVTLSLFHGATAGARHTGMAVDVGVDF